METPAVPAIIISVPKPPLARVPTPTVPIETPIVGAASSTSSSSSLTPDENLNRFYQHGSLTQPTKPSRNWVQTFSDIQNFKDAKRYHDIFKVFILKK